MKRQAEDPRIAQTVVEMVAAHYKTTPAVLTSEQGDPKAKKAVMYILREGLGASLKTAKGAAHKKYDTDVYVAVKAIKEAVKTDTVLAAAIEEIKTEVLMLSAVPGNTQSSPASAHPNSPTRQTVSASGKPNLPERVETTPAVVTGNTGQIIGNVQNAVTRVFLGADLLRSLDPAADVMLAKDAVVFLVWDDFPKITQAEIQNVFHLDQDGLYRSIGRISVYLREEVGELKEKLRAARAAYSQA